MLLAHARQNQHHAAFQVRPEANSALCLYTTHHLCVSAVVDNILFLFHHGTVLREKRLGTVPYQKSYPYVQNIFPYIFFLVRKCFCM